MKIITLGCLLCFLTATSIAQPICGFDSFHKHLMEDPVNAVSLQQAEKRIQDFIRLKPLSPRTLGTGTALYIIPVVVHVVHTGEPIGTIYNPTDAQIIGAIDYLNQVFDGTAAGFSGGAGDIQIQFVLAQRDPNCNPTSGIDRVNGSSLSGYTMSGVKKEDDKSLKNQSRWDPSRYYNIWVVNKIDGQDGTSGQFVAGYAAMAGSSETDDGTVMLSTQMKANNKILPHEIGHAFNLYHTFEKSFVNTQCPVNNNCSVDGDKVCDTDPVSFNGDAFGVIDFTCRTGINSCTGLNYSPYTESNVMGYTDCFTLFTPGQKTRMLAAMSISSRASLASSTAIYPTYSNLSPCPPKLNFEIGSDVVSEQTDFTSGCNGYKDYTYNITIGNSPSSATTVMITAAGTAAGGRDYVLSTNGNFVSPSSSLIFPAGQHNSKSFTLRIYDDAAIEQSESIILSLSIVGSGSTNAVVGDADPTSTITIQDNDRAPVFTQWQEAKVGSFTSNLVSGNTSNPLDAKLASKKTMFLYKASELTAMGLTGGDITSFGIYLTKNSTRPYQNMQIRMGTTNAAYLIDGSIINPPVTTVATFASYSSVNGLNLFSLDVPFPWDGSSNLVVQICYDNSTAATGQVNDICQGYSGGGTASQSNLFYQNNIDCNTEFSQVFTMGNGVKPVAYFVIGYPSPQIETALGASSTASLGPNEDVVFYSPAGKLLARIKNNSSFDYGCTQVLIDRAGNGARAFFNAINSDKVAEKTIHVIPANNNSSGDYDITLYYTDAEISGWEAATGSTWEEMITMKTPNAVSSYTEGTVPNASISQVLSMSASYGNGRALTSGFSNGFSGFAVGKTAAAASYTFSGNGLWSQASNWANNLVPPDILPSGAEIIINPSPAGQCILDKPQTISAGASLKVAAGASFTVNGDLRQQ